MGDENKKNRVNLGSSGNDNFEEPIQDDYSFDNSKKSSGGIIVYVFMGLIIISLIISYYKINKDKLTLEKNISVVKTKLLNIKNESKKKLVGNLHIEIQDPEKDLPDDKKTSSPGVEIYINSELQSDKTGVVDLPKQDIRHDLIFEFKKPGYYPLKLEVKSCNWEKKGDTFVYVNKNIHLVKDDNGMMAIEAANKEKEKEAKSRSNKKKKRRRR